MRAIAWACLAFALIPFDVAADTAQGRVFNDLNGNGMLDAGEPGIATWATQALQIILLPEMETWQKNFLPSFCMATDYLFLL